MKAKNKFSLIPFVNNLMIGYSKKNRENAFDEKKKRPGLKFNPGLALIGLRTTGPWSININYKFESSVLELKNIDV